MRNLGGECGPAKYLELKLCKMPLPQLKLTRSTTRPHSSLATLTEPPLLVPLVDRDPRYPNTEVKTVSKFEAQVAF
jgi:hypothetical protein